MNLRISILLPCAALLATTVVAAAQERPIALREALAEARSSSPDVTMARARAEAARQDSRASGAFRWPAVGVEAGAVRSNDPVAAFGGRLRQGRFTSNDFDPATLNHPDALTDWTGAVGVQWAPVDFSADAAYQAARANAEAAGLSARWAVRATVFKVETRYVEAVGAQQRLDAAEAALKSAEANAHRAELRLGQGMLTEADVLQARAAREGARARRIDAERAVADARERLAVVLGWPKGQVPIPTDTLFSFGTPEGDVHVESRMDLRASEAGLRAADARVRQASRARLPSLQGFARLESHAPNAFSGAEGDWTIGFQLKVPVFTGFKISAMQKAASAMRNAARAKHAALLREAEAQVAEARRAVESARQGARAAVAGAHAADGAAHLMRRRYDEGLITTVDLLAAEAQAAGLRTRAVDARLALNIARARLAFLTGTTTDDVSGGSDR